MMFNVDVIQRAKQCIFITRDIFSTLIGTSLIHDQTVPQLRSGIIRTVQPMRRHGDVLVRADNAKAFESLVKTNDADLQKLNIKLELGDPTNKNSIASVDRAIEELELAIKNISPDGETITETTLAKATMEVNPITRNRGFSASEVHSSREMHTG